MAACAIGGRSRCRLRQRRRVGSGDRGGASVDVGPDRGWQPVRGDRRVPRAAAALRVRRHRVRGGRRIALRGEGEQALSDDVITVAPGDRGARVGYEADLRLKGLYRVAEPFLGSTVERMGDAALDGLAARLAE